MLVFNKKTKKVKNLEPNVAARLIARKNSDFEKYVKKEKAKKTVTPKKSK